jgi:hypothetical protein
MSNTKISCNAFYKKEIRNKVLIVFIRLYKVSR